MKYRLLNYLACPYCKDKGFPLKLIVIETIRYEQRRLPQSPQKPLCDLYCAYKDSLVKELYEKGVVVDQTVTYTGAFQRADVGCYWD
jgi:uncharacterized protein YbaR (Trm112 family)